MACDFSADVAHIWPGHGAASFHLPEAKRSATVLMVQTQQNHILLPGSVALNVHLKKSHNSHNKFIIMHIVCSCVYVYEVY